MIDMDREIEIADDMVLLCENMGEFWADKIPKQTDARYLPYMRTVAEGYAFAALNLRTVIAAWKEIETLTKSEESMTPKPGTPPGQAKPKPPKTPKPPKELRTIELMAAILVGHGIEEAFDDAVTSAFMIHDETMAQHAAREATEEDTGEIETP